MSALCCSEKYRCQQFQHVTRTYDCRDKSQKAVCTFPACRTILQIVLNDLQNRSTMKCKLANEEYQILRKKISFSQNRTAYVVSHSRAKYMNRNRVFFKIKLIYTKNPCLTTKIILLGEGSFRLERLYEKERSYQYGQKQSLQCLEKSL